MKILAVPRIIALSLSFLILALLFRSEERRVG